MGSPSTLYPKKIDLTNCDKEPIHLIGRIQSHAMLFVIDSSSFEISHISENVISTLSRKREEFYSKRLEDVLGQNGTLIETYIKSKNKTSLEVTIDDKRYVVVTHHNNQLVYIELEPIQQQESAQYMQRQLSEIISDLSEAVSVSAMCDKTAKLIKGFTAYDRVMIYKFDENWNGKIISEAREVHLDSWIGMHYPATDIPQQARKLFLKQGVRIIADVASQTVPVYAKPSAEDEPVDLGLCESRASSPIHIEYLENMKVGATLTAAIVSDGELWGLIACHHYSPKFVNYYQRQTVKFLTQVFSTQLTLRASNEVLSRINVTSAIRASLVEQMSDGWDVANGLTQKSTSMLTITEATGGAVFLENNVSTVGETPSNEEITALIDWIYDTQIGDIYTTQNIAEEYDKGAAFAKIGSGLLCIFIAKGEKDCLLWFKPELKQVISWGGNPEKAMEEKAQKLSPRKSFEKWNKEQVNTSLPWKDYEIASAQALKTSISNIIISRYQEVKLLNDKLKEAYKELESFSYSVSHDLRSPLRGIDGFAQIIKEDYFETLDEYGQKAIQTIIDSTSKMNMLIDDILAFSGIGKNQISMGVFSMKDLVEEVVAFLQVDAKYKNAQIIIDPSLPEVFGDRGMIFQLLNNLIGNALKYSQTVLKPIVEIGFNVCESSVVYYVKDNGIGFDNKYNEKIFGVFNRLVKDEFEGSGIGLAISQRVLEKHQGRIWAEGKINDGATFHFQLPNR
ncbi:multi-sensor signal transduction histidine kinase [Dokdonia sp. Hel_I_63]|uniref:ATP-binding protein n=1 Tax=Dokdonia sp. Hel_I_63 TaxID=1249996 RepID=UPI00119B792C|nr:ATP-binding protein [Dokdonia sp. Hel_I_63]TVZ22420.1 multi-sensor signal transduction histidine kinase [Dokdonia sp. Hel_I_63]